MIKKIVSTLQRGGIVILRTDTIYGILARANDQKAVEKIYKLKDRRAHKPLIHLISDASQAFDNSDLIEKYSLKYRDRPTSIIVESPNAPKYLVRNGTSLGYRIERKGLLYEIIQQTGPLVAPSANPEGRKPARTTEQARKYFGDAVNLYVDGGEVPDDVEPSRIIKINPDSSVDILR